MKKIWLPLGIICTLCACGNNTAKPTDDESLSAAVEEILQAQMDSVDAEAGAVIVMDCNSRQALASVETGQVLNESHPSGLTMIPIYLSLLELDAVSENTIVDTGNGISVVNGDTIFDHNWRIGGNGKITMKEAIAKGSYIAFTKAIESYGKIDSINGKLSEMEFAITLNQETQSWLYGTNAYTPIQLLESYTSILGNSNIKDKNKKVLLSNMAECVESGSCKQAKSEVVGILAYPSHYPYREDNSDATYNMEICGFFPQDNPQYSYIVCLKKKGLPVSAGAMCSPIIKKVVENIFNNP